MWAHRKSNIAPHKSGSRAWMMVFISFAAMILGTIFFRGWWWLAQRDVLRFVVWNETYSGNVGLWGSSNQNTPLRRTARSDWKTGLPIMNTRSCAVKDRVVNKQHLVLSTNQFKTGLRILKPRCWRPGCQFSRPGLGFLAKGDQVANYHGSNGRPGCI